MHPNLRWLAVGVSVRTFGNALYFPFLALFLLNVLGVGYLAIGVIFVGVGVVQLPFNFIGGLLTDRIGRRRLILVSLTAEAITTAVLAVAFAERSLAGAIAAATLGGIVLSATGASFSAYIADTAEGADRTRGFTWYRIGFNAGYAAGVTVGGLLITFVGFPGAVAIAALLIGSGAAILFRALGPSPFDLRLAAGARPSDEAPGAAGARPKAGRSLGESVRLLARDLPSLEALLAVGFAALIVGQWSITFPLFVHNVLGVSYSLLGIGLALNGLVVVVGQSTTTERVLGWRHTTIAILGVVLYVVAFVGLGLAGWVGFVPVAVFFVAVVVLTVGENLITIPQTTLPSNLAPAGEVGSYNGAFAAVGGAGFLAAIFVGGLVLSLTTNPFIVWLLLVVPAVPSILLFRDAARRIPRAVDTA